MLSKTNVADMFTKSLDKVNFCRHANKVLSRQGSAKNNNVNIYYNLCSTKEMDEMRACRGRSRGMSEVYDVIISDDQEIKEISRSYN